ncbi:MAG: transglycosylase SLT domain-containing protein [Blastocatellia bacterium]|nr:transglycosylase SLT domain-containing protein [Blastocatellia bacterium]
MSFKTRLFLTLSAVGAVTCLTPAAYAQTPAPVKQAPPAVSTVSDPAQGYIAKARQQYKQGETLFKDGKHDDARLLFDQAVDTLLAAPAEVRNNQDVQVFYFELVNRIHMLQFGATQEVAQSDETPSPLDELASIDINKENVKSDGKLDTSRFDFKFTVTPEVFKFINFYTTGRGRTTMEHGLARSGRYREMAERIFAEEGVPRDLIWLAQVESVWQPSALSWAAAKGIWQFIPATGQRFGLQQNGWIDERVAPEKATRAAARYLKFLNNYFAGDWLLAMAAYNSGEMNVERAIAKCGYADFWELHSRNLLPNETKNYVPAILAVLAVAKEQKKYGFNVTPEPTWKYDTFTLNDQVDLGVVANLLNVPVDTVRSLNPELKRGVTPPNSFDLKLPHGSRSQFEVAFAQLPAEQRMKRPAAADDDEDEGDDVQVAAARRATPSYKTVMVSYKVRRGDTLARVASRYGVSVKDVAKKNRMSSHAELKKGQVLVVPVVQKAGGKSRYSTRPVSRKQAARHHGRRR